MVQAVAGGTTSQPASQAAAVPLVDALPPPAPSSVPQHHCSVTTVGPFGHGSGTPGGGVGIWHELRPVQRLS